MAETTMLKNTFIFLCEVAAVYLILYSIKYINDVFGGKI